MEFVRTEYTAADFGKAWRGDDRPHKYNKVQRQLLDFVSGSAEVVRVDFSAGEYRSVMPARTSILKSAQMVGVHIRTTIRDGVLYLIK